MLRAFQKFGATLGAKVLMVLLIVAFGAWGIQGYLSNYTTLEAMTVNGEGISPQVLEQALKNRKEGIARVLGREATPDELAQMELPRQIINETASRVVLQQTARELGLTTATAQLQDEIRKMAPFQGVNGFDAALYRRVLQQVGRTPEQFERDLSQDLAVRDLAKLMYLAPATTSPSSLLTLAAEQAKAENVTLELEVATLQPSLLTAVAAPTEASLTAFYNANQQLYMKPERRDVLVMTLEPKAMLAKIEIPAGRIESYYRDNSPTFVLPERRAVRHILVKSKAEAEKLAAEIKTVDDFAKLANANTIDPGNQGRDGVLGEIEPSDVVPAFAQVAFGISTSTLSAPVQTQFGWHLIWVDKIVPAGLEPLDAKLQAKIKEELQRAEVEELFDQLPKQIADMQGEGQNLSQIGKALGLPVQSLSQLAANAERPKGMPQEVFKAAFAEAEGRVSSPLMLADDSMVYVQATKVVPASLPTLAEVRPAVEKNWRAAEAQRQLQAAADALLGQARAPGAPALANLVKGLPGLASAPSVSVLKFKDVQGAPQWLAPRVLELYGMANGGVLPTALRENEDWHVVRVAARELTPVSSTLLAQNAMVFGERLQRDVEDLMLNYLNNQAKVTLNQPRLQAVFGEGFSGVAR